MHILMTGSTGFVGTALSKRLTSNGHKVTALTHHSTSKVAGVISIPVDFTKTLDPKIFSGVGAVIHLAGSPIAGMWTERHRTLLLQSRILPSHRLVSAMQQLSPHERPEVLVSASAVGYYGDRPGEELSEASAKGSGFIPDLSDAWEQSCRTAEQFGIRTVQVRTGFVLGNGGLLEKLLPIFRCGLGTSFGSGNQYFPWVSLEKLVDIYERAITTQLSGPVNAVSSSVPYHEFADTLASLLHRPRLLSIPRPFLRAALGELGDSLCWDQNIQSRLFVQKNDTETLSDAIAQALNQS